MSRREIEEEAARWLLRREEAGWSTADEAAHEAWLQGSFYHKAAFWRLEHGWDALGRLRAVKSGGSARRPPRSWLRTAFAAAACLVAALLLPYGFQRSTEPASEQKEDQRASFSTSLGARRVILLPDGSRVELNTASTVQARVDDRERIFWLRDGEAYFEVAHAKHRPFVVYAGSKRISVLGTKFLVRKDGAKVEVGVVEGRVRIDDIEGAPSSRSNTIKGGDLAISQTRSTLIMENASQRVENALSWRSGMLVFDNISLRDAAAEFNRYNKHQIIISDERTAAIRIGGTFQAKNVEAFVRLLKEAYGLKTEMRGQDLEITS